MVVLTPADLAWLASARRARGSRSGGRWTQTGRCRAAIARSRAAWSPREAARRPPARRDSRALAPGRRCRMHASRTVGRRSRSPRRRRLHAGARASCVGASSTGSWRRAAGLAVAAAQRRMLPSIERCRASRAAPLQDVRAAEEARDELGAGPFVDVLGRADLLDAARRSSPRCGRRWSSPRPGRG